MVRSEKKLTNLNPLFDVIACSITGPYETGVHICPRMSTTNIALRMTFKKASRKKLCSVEQETYGGCYFTTRVIRVVEIYLTYITQRGIRLMGRNGRQN